MTIRPHVCHTPTSTLADHCCSGCHRPSSSCDSVAAASPSSVSSSLSSSSSWTAPKRSRYPPRTRVTLLITVWVSILLNLSEIRCFQIQQSKKKTCHHRAGVDERHQQQKQQQLASISTRTTQQVAGRSIRLLPLLHVQLDGDNDDKDEEVLGSFLDNDDDDYDEGEMEFDSTTVAELTVPQLKQQLRLRQLKVSGKKQELADRLLQFGYSRRRSQDAAAIQRKTDDSTNNDVEIPTLVEDKDADATMADEVSEDYLQQTRRNKAQKIAQEHGKEFIDVTAYLDEEDKGKDVKSLRTFGSDTPDPDDKDASNVPLSDPEVWGADAKIVDDYEGRSPVVDALSRTVIEFKGSNQTMVQAFVVASRDAMKPFLEGGNNRTITNSDPESRMRELQIQREEEDKRPVRAEDNVGLDDGDETGIFKDVLHRDFSDWGKYSVTGAQLSAQEVQGILILSDVFGPFTEATKTLAEKIAFECQPVVCMVPDLFRGKPWKEDMTTPGFNEDGQDYEEWRAMHSDVRVNVDIRAASAVLREQYGVSSIVVWGLCFGGGRALEVAAGYLPENKILDVDGVVGPPLVDPEVVIAWYPTRYNANNLFGVNRSPVLSSTDDKRRQAFAVMAVFAGKDKLAGATPEDAAELKALLEVDERVKDYMVKVFPDQDHGFAHNTLGRNHDESELDRFVDNEFGGAGRVSINDGDAEVACLLSTAFMETYSRQFLPTVGTPIKEDEFASEWNKELSMKDLSDATRDVRSEIEQSLQDFKEVPLQGIRVDPENPDDADKLLEALKAMEPDNVPDEYRIDDDDDLETVYGKLLAADDSFQIF